MKAATISVEEATNRRTAPGEAAPEVRVVQQRLDLQTDTRGGEAWLELREPDAMTGGLWTVKGEAEDADSYFLEGVESRGLKRKRFMPFEDRP